MKKAKRRIREEAEFWAALANEALRRLWSEEDDLWDDVRKKARQETGSEE